MDLELIVFIITIVFMLIGTPLLEKHNKKKREMEEAKARRARMSAPEPEATSAPMPGDVDTPSLVKRAPQPRAKSSAQAPKSQQTAAAPTKQKAKMAQWLSDRENLRRAIVLSEVLNPKF